MPKNGALQDKSITSYVKLKCCSVKGRLSSK